MGRYLGDHLTEEQVAYIRRHEGEELHEGDYWIVDGFKWRIDAIYEKSIDCIVDSPGFEVSDSPTLMAYLRQQSEGSYQNGLNHEQEDEE